jgi:hypothetical protein
VGIIEMSQRSKKYYSIAEDISNSLVEAAPSLLSSIIASLLLIFLYINNKDAVEILRTIQENVALNLICLWFFSCLMTWGVYLLSLSLNPELYLNFPEGKDWILNISRGFVRFSSVTFGVIFSARMFLRVLQFCNIKPIKELVDLGNINYEVIIICLCFLIFIPYYWILKPVMGSRKRSDYKLISRYRSPLFELKNRFILFVFGGLMILFSVRALLLALF